MSFWDAVNKVIRKADIIIEVVDARNVEGSRNKEIEEKVAAAKKKLILVINKCDLVDIKKLKVPKGAIFVSSTEYHGMKMLKEKILTYAKQKKIKPKVGVVGYPNVGKSSLVNVFGRGKAITSSSSGMTKGTQLIAVRGFTFLDTPGVLPRDDDKEMHVEIGAVDFSKTKDPESAFYYLYGKYQEVLEKYYDIKAEDEDEFLEILGKKKGLLRKGGVDVKRAAVFVLKEWQTGKIKQ